LHRILFISSLKLNNHLLF